MTKEEVDVAILLSRKRIYQRARLYHDELYDSFEQIVMKWQDLSGQELCPFCAWKLPKHRKSCTLVQANQVLDKILGIEEGVRPARHG